MDIKSIRGMNDIYLPEIYVWRHIEKIVREHFENFGYSEIKTPLVEPTTLFARNLGETTDVVQKEMYTFNDRNNESLTLRPEGTAPVVRALVEHNLLAADPVQKFYYWGPMFRYERPQKGRYRQFHQYGIEIFGIENAHIDAELIAMTSHLYEKFGLKNLRTKLSSMGCSECRPKYREALLKLLEPKVGLLCKDCQERYTKNPLRIFDCKNPQCAKVAEGLPNMLDYLDDECHKHFDAVRDGLVKLRCTFEVDKRLVRGFDYYNRTVFEIITEDLGAQNAVGGGGRYDKLVEELGGPVTPAIGYAGGIERLAILLGERQDLAPALKLFVVLPDEKGMDIGFPLAFKLRSQGVSVEMDYTGKSMKSQMKRADKLKAQYVLILGGQEIEQGAGVLRNMSTKAQESVPLKDLEGELLRRLK